MFDITFVLVVEAILIFLGVELLMRRLPTALQKASRDNCYRIDGSWSSRRANYEREAQLRIRLDLFATFLIVALTGNGLGLFVHSYVIPIPLAIQALSLFQSDASQWKESIYEQGIDQDYEAWNRNRTLGSVEEIEAATSDLWNNWPTVVTLGIGWLFASYWLLFAAHTHALHQFNSGIKTRCEKHLNLDITRLASESDAPFLHHRDQSPAAKHHRHHKHEEAQ